MSELPICGTRYFRSTDHVFCQILNYGNIWTFRHVGNMLLIFLLKDDRKKVMKYEFESWNKYSSILRSYQVKNIERSKWESWFCVTLCCNPIQSGAAKGTWWQLDHMHGELCSVLLIILPMVALKKTQKAGVFAWCFCMHQCRSVWWQKSCTIQIDFNRKWTKIGQSGISA